jgi:hypothetical protein
MTNAPTSKDKKAARQEKLAAALRANLKRRKAAKRQDGQAGEQSSRLSKDAPKDAPKGVSDG